MADGHIADILGDIPKLRGIALGPMARNPLLQVLLEQANALGQIAQWTADVQTLLAQQEQDAPAPAADASAEHANGHATLPAPIAAREARSKGG